MAERSGDGICGKAGTVLLLLQETVLRLTTRSMNIQIASDLHLDLLYSRWPE